MKQALLFTFSIFSCLLSSTSLLKAQTVTILQQDKPTSIRGLSVVDDKTAWISGSKGYIAKTADGGKTWDWQQLKGYEKSDFRDIEAFSDKEAVIMSSGSPSYILKTTDGGLTWQEKYQKTDTSYFLDAMDFADATHGYILGDPINNKFLLLETKDGGETWAKSTNPPTALPGEAAFAASGTCLRVLGEGAIYIASGGKSSRLISLSKGKSEWEYANLPISQGKSSEGAFSVAIQKNKGIIVGGDYANDKMKDSVAVITTYKNRHAFQVVTHGPEGFQSSVEHIADGIFLSTGTPGSNLTTDGGLTWKQIDTTSFNVCRKAKRGKLVLLAGNGGKIALFKM
ncbi:photosynthesis system II assembly factor YCF48-like protein [Mucilaginibacter oryzae]|uniref:Photosynthesis system II assembly factor YCF48-like protein n=1 Tax=Mucilaginibacter oryzae TaxID=468058 RepID=A0A316HHB2_9SPHI|nr:YCF48-related protein [Mucilaginibacter oryzae]PWK80018.1 photosynthesis system II assembly factor YCF48-like protein [Mucilaginibacter oryzae]